MTTTQHLTVCTPSHPFTHLPTHSLYSKALTLRDKNHEAFPLFIDQQLKTLSETVPGLHSAESPGIYFF